LIFRDNFRIFLLCQYYKDDPARRGLLWAPEAKSERVEATAPLLLHTLLVLFNLIREKGQPLMPHEVLAMVMEYLDSTKDDAVIDAWQLVAKWCLLASQTWLAMSGFVSIGSTTQTTDIFLSVADMSRMSA
jgi:hypothetical protein